MNSRSGVNETSLVNFPAEISTLNQLDSKDGLLSFPFDHIYACHSEATSSTAVALDKTVEIAPHCVAAAEEVASSSSDVCRLSERLAAVEQQNTKLKELLIYHLDLIQQQNDLITKRDKSFQSLKQENETLKSRLSRMDRRVTLHQRHSSNPPPLVHVSGLPHTTVKTETATSNNQMMLNSLSDFLIPETRPDPFSFESELDKPEGLQDIHDLKSTRKDVPSYLSPDSAVTSILNRSIKPSDIMIEGKRTAKKEPRSENRSERLYTITGTSANPVIQRIQRNRRRTLSVTSSLNRAPKSPAPIKSEPLENNANNLEENKYTVNKKNKMINTYGKCSKNGSQRKMMTYTGSLSERLRLIDTTPTGEDPYQLGEAEMREQSPIPKLMLQKTNQGRMRVRPPEPSDTAKLFDPMAEALEDSTSSDVSKIELNKYNLPNAYMHPSEIKKEGDDLDLDIVKTEPEVEWYNKPATSLSDFSYGSGNNLASRSYSARYPAVESMNLQELFSGSTSLYQGETHPDVSCAPTHHKSPTERPARRGSRIASVVMASLAQRPWANVRNTGKGGGLTPSQRAGHHSTRRAPGSLLQHANPIPEKEDPTKAQDKRARKRALSTGLLKTGKREGLPKPAPTKPKLVKGRGTTLPAACRAKKSPVPGRETKKVYHTLVGDPDLSWYLGLDPDVKPDDVDQAGVSLKATVEVPRWREKPISPSSSNEGIENLDDKTFEKRHQKYEAEERRQLRWHMRRVREQSHLQKLKQRQRDPWCSSATPNNPSTYTVWPQPQRDLRFIEITDTLPVTAFGEPLPALPDSEFVLPWVRTSKAQKRSKRSKTLH